MSTIGNEPSADQRQRLNDALRAYGEAYAQLGRAFAASTGLHSTDATALLEILRAEEEGEPLSPARLGDRIGLTSGATSTLLNRLEDVGHIVRSRVHTDRRIVTLHSTPGVHATADAFFQPLDDRFASAVAAYTPEALDQFIAILGQLYETMESYRSERDRDMRRG
jgi:DNA-binding MarR family transcriptional regulator